MHINKEQLIHRGKKIGTTVAAVLVVFIFMLFFILQAAPGNPLYAAKVNVVEEAVEYGYFTAPAKANYHLTLMERRLGETETLAKRAVGNEGDANYLFSESEERARELLALLAANENGAFTQQESLDLTHELLVLLRAEEEVAERSESISAYADRIEEVRREIAQAFDSRADQLAAHGTSEEVSEFLNGLLEELLVKVELNQMSDSTRKSVERAVKNAQDDIESLKPGDAIATLGDALRLIAVEERIGIDPEDMEEESAPEETSTTTTSTTSASTTTTNASSSLPASF